MSKIFSARKDCGTFSCITEAFIVFFFLLQLEFHGTKVNRFLVLNNPPIGTCLPAGSFIIFIGQLSEEKQLPPLQM